MREVQPLRQGGIKILAVAPLAPTRLSSSGQPTTLQAPPHAESTQRSSRRQPHKSGRSLTAM
eukprot:2728130-Prorocentrum_lima.AAC.1